MPKEHEKRKRECMPRGHEKNNPMLKSMKKRREKREKDSPYLQIKGNHQKERES